MRPGVARFRGRRRVTPLAETAARHWSPPRSFFIPFFYVNPPGPIFFAERRGGASGPDFFLCDSSLAGRPLGTNQGPTVALLFFYGWPGGGREEGGGWKPLPPALRALDRHPIESHDALIATDHALFFCFFFQPSHLAFIGFHFIALGFY